MVVVLFVVSPLTGVLEKLSYLTAWKYFPLNVISILVVFEPYIGQAFGILLNQDRIPGTSTFLGLIVTSFGFCIAWYGEYLRHDHEIWKIIEGNKLSQNEIDDEDSSF